MGYQKQFYVQANGIRLHYLKRGQDGPPLILLPTMAGVAETQLFIADALASYATVFVMEYRGRGLSEHRDGLGYTLDDYSADVNGLLECLSIPSAIILGHSMGGRIGIRMAASSPERVGKLITLDAPLCGPERQYPFPVDSFLEGIREVAEGRSVDPPWTAHWTEKQRMERVKWLPTCSEEAMIASFRGLNEEDVLSNIPEITCPTLMLFADEGMVVPLDHIAEFQESVTDQGNVRVQQMNNVGHMAPWDDLDQVVSLVRDFIAA